MAKHQLLNSICDVAREKARNFEPGTPPHIRETLEDRYGSVANAIVHGIGRVLSFTLMVFAAFIAAILNLARKS